MSLEATIHQRWADDAALTAIVPAARLFTGAAVGEVRLPYVVLRPAPLQTAARGSGALSIVRAQLEFNIWAASLETVRQVAAAIADQFDRTDFALDAGYVCNLQWTGTRETIDADGRWHCLLQYQALMET